MGSHGVNTKEGREGGGGRNRRGMRAEGEEIERRMKRK